MTNTGAKAVDITGWKMDDNSNSFAAAVPMSGITSIATGESVIFLESAAPATDIAAFKTLWFGANPPAGLQVGTYSGSGVGLSNSGDAVNLFNSAGALQASATFPIFPGVSVFQTFENAGASNNTQIRELSAVGFNNAQPAVNDATEIGSPGNVGKAFVAAVIVAGSGVTNATITSAAFTLNQKAASPAFFLFGATKYIAAQHGDYSYVGPASLSVPGYTFTPAKPNETIALYGNGFGLPATALTEGSYTQSAKLPELPVVTISYKGVQTLGALITVQK